MSTDPLDELIENEILESQLYNILHDHGSYRHAHTNEQGSLDLPQGDQDVDPRSTKLNVLKRPSNSLCDEAKIKECKRSNKRPRSKSILIPHTSHELPSEEEQSATIKSHSCPLH